MTIQVTPIPRLTSLTTPAFTLGLTNAAGDALTAVASNSTLLAFDTTAPASVSTANATGSATVASRRDHVHEGTVAASAAQVTTATSTTLFVSPGRTKYSPSALKVWGKFEQVGGQTILIDEGLDSITDAGTGVSTLAFDADFNGVNYSFASDSSSYTTTCDTFAAGSCKVKVFNDSGSAEDSGEVSLMATGTFA